MPLLPVTQPCSPEASILCVLPVCTYTSKHPQMHPAPPLAPPEQPGPHCAHTTVSIWAPANVGLLFSDELRNHVRRSLASCSCPLAKHTEARVCVRVWKALSTEGTTRILWGLMLVKFPFLLASFAHMDRVVGLSCRFLRILRLIRPWPLQSLFLVLFFDS